MYVFKRFHKSVVLLVEAKYTLVCRKLFKQQLAIENIPEEVVDTYYKKDAPHDMYIAEVLEILKTYAFAARPFLNIHFLSFILPRPVPSLCSP